MGAGGKTFGKAGSGGTIDHDGKKHPFRDSQGGTWRIGDVHPAAWDVEMTLRIYNDYLAEIQEGSGGRFIPMPVMPAWDIPRCVGEAQRVAELGLKGVNMTADPQDSGSPDLGDPAWDPFWEACAGLDLAVHFHIGASQTSMSYFDNSYGPSQDDYVKPAIGGATLFQNSSRLLLNSCYSGMFDRHAVGVLLHQTGTRRSGSRPAGATCSTSSTPSARTASSSRPTSPTPRRSTRTPSRWWPEDRHAPLGDPAQGHGRERRPPVPAVGGRWRERTGGRGLLALSPPDARSVPSAS